MFDKLLSTAATNAKLVVAAAAGAALVAGGSAVAISNVADSGSAPTAPTSASAGHVSQQGLDSQSDTATVGISPKPSHSPKANQGKGQDGQDGQGNAQHPANHGACVSAVAKASPAPSASPGDHGKLVSAVAKSDCGKSSGGTTDQAGSKGKSAQHKPTKANGHSDGTSDASEAPEPSDSPDASEAPDSGQHGSRDTGTTHSNGHSGGH